MKKNRILALLLSACLLAAILAGCGSSSESSSASSSAEAEDSAASVEEEAAPSEEPEEVSEEIPVEEPAEEPEEEPEEEPADEPPAAEEPVPEEQSTTIAYPCGNGETVTAWVTLETPFREAIEDWNDMYTLSDIVEATGVNLQFQTIGSDAAEEQFPLMIASGDWTDLIPISYYTGGDEQAYEDEVIIDLTDLLPDNAPDYWAYLQDMDTVSQNAALSGDRYLTLYTLLDQYYIIQGTVIRQDWLDDLGMDTPADLESLSTALKAFKDTYDPEYTIYTSAGSLDYLSDLFGTYIVGYSNNSLPVYVDGNEVRCTYSDDGYRDYIEWFAEMYAYGVINPDFYNVNEMDGTSRNTYIAANDVGLWSARCESIDEWKDYTADSETLANARPEALPYLTDGDGVFNWASEMSRLYERVCWCITTSAEDPALVVQFLNYFFTEEGSVMSNYGEEGFTFEYVNGEPQYTDMVLNNPDGYTAQLSVNVYTSSAVLPCYSIESKLFVSYTENAQAAIDIYNENVSADHAYPSGAALTTAETNAISNDVLAINTYCSEQLLKFMTGSDPVTDESWQTYLDEMESLGLSDCLAVYQSSYDNYLAK